MRVEMNFANVMALITTVVGLPSAVAYYRDGQQVVAVLVALLVAGVIVGVLFWRWHTNQPIVTFVNHEKTLTFEDKDAHRAIQVSKMRVRANYRGVQRLKMGTARGDGPIKNILIDGQPPNRYRGRFGR